MKIVYYKLIYEWMKKSVTHGISCESCKEFRDIVMKLKEKGAISSSLHKEVNYIGLNSVKEIINHYDEVIIFLDCNEISIASSSNERDIKYKHIYKSIY